MLDDRRGFHVFAYQVYGVASGNERQIQKRVRMARKLGRVAGEKDNGKPYGLFYRRYKGRKLVRVDEAAADKQGVRARCLRLFGDGRALFGREIVRVEKDPVGGLFCGNFG